MARLESMGYQALYLNRVGPALLRRVKAEMPHAVLIDLSRLPSQGRDVAVTLRLTGATRSIPIVFVDGLPEKVMLVRETLPDAVYSTWTHLAEDLDLAIRRPPRTTAPQPPVESAGAAKRPARVAAKAPASVERKSPLAGKLGIKEDNTVVVLGAPHDFIDNLGQLPKGASLRSQLGEDSDLAIWFVRSRRELNENLPLRVARMGQSRLWILYPKKPSGQTGDLTQADVRQMGLGEGLSEEKSASIDSLWSGTLFKK